MLRLDQTALLLDALRPPHGMEIDMAVGTTFTPRAWAVFITPVIAAEIHPSHPGLDLVRDQQDVALAADAAQRGHEVGRGYYVATFALNRLDHDARDAVDAQLPRVGTRPGEAGTIWQAIPTRLACSGPSSLGPLVTTVQSGKEHLWPTLSASSLFVASGNSARSHAFRAYPSFVHSERGTPGADRSVRQGQLACNSRRRHQIAHVENRPRQIERVDWVAGKSHAF